MRPRKTGPTATKSKYKYVGAYDESGEWVPAHVRCEYEGDHQVTPSKWPIPNPTNNPSPSMDATCELCGCGLVVYPGHATGELSGIKIVLNREKQPA